MRRAIRERCVSYNRNSCVCVKVRHNRFRGGKNRSVDECVWERKYMSVEEKKTHTHRIVHLIGEVCGGETINM